MIKLIMEPKQEETYCCANSHTRNTNHENAPIDAHISPQKLKLLI